MDAPVFGASVLLDGQLRRLDIDLLDDQSQSAVETQRAAAAGTGGKRVDKELIDLLRGEQGAFVLGMARLAAAMAFVLAGRRRRRGRLDDVRRGRLGGSRGVLAGGGELLLQTSHRGLQLLQLSAMPLYLDALLLQLCLQPLASGTGVRCCFCHALIHTRVCLTSQQAVNSDTPTVRSPVIRRSAAPERRAAPAVSAKGAVSPSSPFLRPS